MKRTRHFGAIQYPFCIGVSGLQGGCGTTHTAIMIAEYLHRCCGYNTAYVECGTKNEIGELAEGVQGSFYYDGICMYPAAGDKALNLIRKNEHQAVVVDYGSGACRRPTELWNCYIQCIVASASVWKQKELLRWAEHTPKSQQKNYRILIPCADQQIVNRVRRECQITVWPIPVQQDPFGIKPPVIQFMNSLI